MIYEPNPMKPDSDNDPTELGPSSQSNQSDFQTYPTRAKAFLEEEEVFAHYQIGKELGRGGMGVVYKAWDRNLARMVAIKLVLPGRLSQGKDIERFLHEAKTTAHVSHENVVKIYEVGEEPQHYFAMEYVEGSSLKSYVQNNVITAREIAFLFEKCARGLQSIHEKGIVHRDLKPGNIMVDKSKNPKIMDFGLAKRIDVKSGLSHPGEILGTPVYMSPEQACGDSLGPKTDIYSLGATLYETLTRRPPFQGDSYGNVVTQIMNTDCIPPRQLNPDIPRDLEAITLKCLEKKPNKRYATAQDLAQDLKNFQENLPVQAKPVTPLTRFQKWVSRNRALSIALTLLFLTHLFGGLFSTVQWRKAEREKEKALVATENERKERHRAEEEIRKARHELGNALLQRARIYLKENLFFEAGLTACRAIGFEGFGGPLSHCPPLLFPQSEEWQETCLLLRKQPHFRMLWHSPSLRQHPQSVRSVSFSPNGKWLASGGGKWDNTLQIWELSTGEVAFSRTLEETDYRVSFSPDGRFLALASPFSKRVELSNTDDFRTAMSYEHSSGIHAIVFSPDGKFLASAGKDKTGHLWEVETGKKVFSFSNSGSIHCVAFSPDGKFLASGGKGGSIELRESHSGKKVLSFGGRSEAVQSLAFHPQGDRLSSGSEASVDLWDVSTGKSLASFSHEGPVCGLLFSPDGKIVFAGGGDGKIVGRELETGKERSSWQAHAGTVHGMALSPDGKTIASAGEGNTIGLWQMETGKNKVSSNGHSFVVAQVAFDPRGKRAASVAWDNTVRIWDLSSAETIAFLPHAKTLFSLAFSPDGKILATGSSEGIALWETERYSNVSFPDSHRADVRDLSFSPDGKLLASASIDKSVKVWDMESLKLVTSMKRPYGILSLDFSPDGRRIAFGENGPEIHLWEWKDGKTISLPAHSRHTTKVRFGSDGRILVSCGGYEMKVWEVSQEKISLSFSADIPTNVLSLALSPDGKMVAAAGDDEIKLWDLSTHAPLACLTGHRGNIRGLAFGPYSKTLLSAGEDRTLKLWELGPREISYSFPSGMVDVAFCPDGKKLATVMENGTVSLVEAATGDVLYSFPGAACVAFRPDGKMLASTTPEGAIQFLETESLKKTSFHAHSGEILGLAFSPDGKLLASSSGDKTVKLWKMKEGMNLHKLLGQTSYVLCVAFSPDGKTLASGSMDKSIRRWDVATGNLLFTSTGHSGHVSGVAFSPDGKLLASSSADRTIRLWTMDGQLLSTLSGHSDCVNGLSFSPDGKLLASGSADKSVRVWEVSSGKTLAIFGKHDHFVKSVSFGPDGKTIASAGADRSVKVWPLGDFPFAEYLSVAEFKKMDVCWKEPGQNLLGSPGRSFPPSAFSSLAILKSQIPEPEKDRLLGWRYLRAGAFGSAFLSFERIPQGHEKERLREAIARRLSEIQAQNPTDFRARLLEKLNEKK